MRDIVGFLESAAAKTGFHREVYNANNIPTDPSNITIIPFFGDIRSQFILSSFLLHRFKEQEKPSKYLILCSWPGFSSLFPYVDEYWSIENENLKKIYSEAIGMENKSEVLSSYFRSLSRYFFEDVVSENYFKNYYGAGLTNQYWATYKNLKKFLPLVQSSTSLGKDLIRDFNEKGGFKLFVYPSLFIKRWHQNRPVNISTSKDFWVALVKRIVREKITPVICKNVYTHDITSDFIKDAICFNGEDFGKVLSAMRLSGCVLDIFTGISKLAIAARTPFVYTDERLRYANLKEYEIDDLCGLNIPKKYIFSFSTIIDGGNFNTWDNDIFNSIVVKLRELLPSIDRESLPPTSQSFENVSYEIVRNRKFKKIGARLVKIPKDN